MVLDGVWMKGCLDESLAFRVFKWCLDGVWMKGCLDGVWVKWCLDGGLDERVLGWRCGLQGV